MKSIPRGSFLAGALCCGAATLHAPPASAAAPWQERVLWLLREGSNEEAYVPFCKDGYHVYMPGYHALCWILRDHHVDPSIGYVNFSMNTIEALWEVQQIIWNRAGRKVPMVISSGYRTADTNASTPGAAHYSQHIRATAVDMYVDGVSMQQLFNDCYSRAISGGIGYYNNHVHLDTGDRRYWVGQADIEHKMPVNLADVGSLANRRIILV